MLTMNNINKLGLLSLLTAIYYLNANAMKPDFSKLLKMAKNVKMEKETDTYNIYNKDQDKKGGSVSLDNDGWEKVPSDLLAPKETGWNENIDGQLSRFLDKNQNENELIGFIRESNIDANYKFNGTLPLLHLAISNEWPRLVETLIKEHADVNIKETLTGLTPLHKAVISRNKNNEKFMDETFKYLVYSGADKNIEDAKGRVAEEYFKIDYFSNN